MGRKINVLGLGASLSLYIPDGSLAIGVNDIWSRVKTDYIVCLDKRERFIPERLKTIDESEPIIFFSQLDDWQERKDFEKIELQPDFPNYKCPINSKKLPKSLCSPFVATVIAYKLGATEIHLYGVDLVNHPHLEPVTCEQIKLHFRNLKIALIQNGCQLIIHGQGILKKL
jgi:hypothetical protein